MSNLILEFLYRVSELLGLKMGPVTYLGFFRAVTAILLFGYVGLHDLQNRQIPSEPWIQSIKNKTLPTSAWTPMLVLALGFLAWELTHGVIPVLLPRIAANIAIAVFIGFGLYYLPKIPGVPHRWKLFAKGDMKAFTLLGIYIPTYPFIGPFPIFRPEAYITRLFIISVIQWTAVAGIAYLLLLAVRTVLKSKGEFTFPESLLGYKIHPDELPKNKNWRALHDINGKITFDGLPGKVVARYMEWRNNDENGAIELNNYSELENPRLERFLHDTDWGPNPEETDIKQEHIEHDETLMLKVANSDEIWVTPEIPLVFLISVGVILSLIIGDPLYMALQLL